MIETDGGGMRPINDALTKLMRERDDAEARADASAREVARYREALERLVAADPSCNFWSTEVALAALHADTGAPAAAVVDVAISRCDECGKDMPDNERWFVYGVPGEPQYLFCPSCRAAVFAPSNATPSTPGMGDVARAALNADQPTAGTPEARDGGDRE